MPLNTYSARWFDLFLRTIDPSQTAREVAFLRRWLPQPTYSTLVDLCCGPGRHAHLLAEAGYLITGIDRDPAAIAEARSRAVPNETYIEHDMRQLRQLNLRADAVLCLWQSFGYFDAPTNQAILGDLAAMLPDGGRCVLDLYHHDFFAAPQGTRIFEQHGATISQISSVVNGRLHVVLTEAETELDRFEWQLWTPNEFIALARSVGLTCLAQCTNYDEQQAPAATAPRGQSVFVKAAVE